MPGNTSKIEIAIEVDDNGSVKIRQLGDEVEKTAKKGDKSFRQMDTSLGGFNTRLAAGVGRIRSFGAAWGGFMGVFAGAGAVAGLGRLAGEYENSIFQMSKTFGDRTDYMITKARELSESTRKYYDLSSVAYAFIKTADSMERYGITGDKYLTLVTRAADVGAAKNLELKESIDRIESAMRGEAEASEYLGVTLNDTYMKNIAFGGALKDVWERLSDNQKAQARYAELLDQTEKYQGAAGEAANTLSGSFGSLWAALKDRLNPALESTSGLLAQLAVNLREVIAPSADPLAAYQLRLQERIQAISAMQRGVTAAGVAGVPGMGTLAGADELTRLKAMAADLGELARAAEDYRRAVTPPAATAATQFDPASLKPAPSLKTAAKDADGLDRDFWQVQAADRYAVQSRAYERLLEQDAAYEQKSEAIARDSWQVQAADRYAVQSRALEALIEAEQAHSLSLLQLSERTAWAMQDNFSTFFYDALRGELDDLEDYFSAFFDSILRASTDVLGQMVTQGLFGQNFQGGGFFGTVAGMIGDFFGGATGAGAASVTSLAGARWSPRAAGGPVYPGQTYLVGERGPELLVTGKTAGYVQPTLPAAAPASNSITINVAVSGGPSGDAAELRERGRLMGRAVGLEVRRVIANELRPGGMLNRLGR